MSRIRYRNSLPPGLKAQIFFAAAITISALLVLPSDLSAEQSVKQGVTVKVIAVPSAGQVATTIKEFRAGEFAASEFSDWD